MEIQAGFRERMSYLILCIIEIGTALLTFKGKYDNKKIKDLYEEFCDQEYPKIGEMESISGFVEYVRL
jgi:hypothetical protein